MKSRRGSGKEEREREIAIWSCLLISITNKTKTVSFWNDNNKWLINYVLLKIRNPLFWLKNKQINANANILFTKSWLCQKKKEREIIFKYWDQAATKKKQQQHVFSFFFPFKYLLLKKVKLLHLHHSWCWKSIFLGYL